MEPPVDPDGGFVELGWHADAALALRLHRVVFVRGDPGSGKTEFVVRQCRAATGREPEELQAGPNVEEHSLFGCYVLEGDHTPFRDGPLMRAVKEGSWLVVNDAAQLPLAQMSVLLPLRHGDRLRNPISHEVVAVPAEFRLVLTLNPENMTCRTGKTAFQSLLDGGVLVDVPEPTAGDLRRMLVAQRPGLSRTRLERVIAICERHRGLAGCDSDKKRIPIGVRALLQLADNLEAGQEETAAVLQTIVGKLLLDKDKYDAAVLAATMG